MSQKDQEAAIDERIERIRKRNEEIQRRYLEVEADKLNAEKLNAAVKFSPAKHPDAERKSYNKPESANRNPRFERKLPDKPYVPKHQVHGKKTSFADNDKPPPDPVYTFLSDSSRDTPKFDHPSDENTSRENYSGGNFKGSRGGGRGWSRGRSSPGRGGKRGSGNQQIKQSPQMQPDYQAWRAEREKIDQDRITRQKTAEGNWRREWDMKKLSQDEDHDYNSRPAYSKKKRRESDEFKIQRTVVNELASPATKDQEGKSSEKSLLAKTGSRGSTGEKKTVAFKVNDGSSSENCDTETQETSFEHRNIVSCGDSIKIQLSNRPIKSVKVNPVNSAGTGRVGPRQKPRLSYSSQSEDEKEVRAPILRNKALGYQGDQSSAMIDDVSKKPPLPPRVNTGSPKKQAVTKSSPSTSKESESPITEGKELSRGSSHENISEAGDDSWEDVATTSGNESADFSDADVTKKSNSKEDLHEDSKIHDALGVEDDSPNELNENSVLDSSEVESFQFSQLKEETTIKEKNITYEDDVVEQTEQESFLVENLGDIGQQEDELYEKGEEYDSHLSYDADNIKSSAEVETKAKENESQTEETYKNKEVNTSKSTEQKKDAISSAEKYHEELSSHDFNKDIISSENLTETLDNQNLKDNNSSNKVEENNSLLKSIEGDDKDNNQEVCLDKFDLIMKKCDKLNVSETDEKLKAQGISTQPETGNGIDSNSEICPKEQTEGTDASSVNTENYSQPNNLGGT